MCMSKTKGYIVQILKSFIQCTVNESVCITIMALSLPSFSIAQALSQKSFSHVNSPYDEQSPFISPDGKVLYWTLANHPDNIGGKKDPGDIWYSVWTGEEWSLPIHGGNKINDLGYNGVAGFSNDGGRLYLLSH